MQQTSVALKQSAKMLILKRKWWNWQTHHLEGVAPKGVGVQIPPSAPKKLATDYYPPNEMVKPPATMSAPPIRIGSVGAWPNLTRATICASRKKSTT